MKRHQGAPVGPGRADRAGPDRGRGRGRRRARGCILLGGRGSLERWDVARPPILGLVEDQLAFGSVVGRRRHDEASVTPVLALCCSRTRSISRFTNAGSEAWLHSSLLVSSHWSTWDSVSESAVMSSETAMVEVRERPMPIKAIWVCWLTPSSKKTLKRGSWSRRSSRSDGSISRMALTPSHWRLNAFADEAAAEARRAELEAMNPGHRYAVVAL